MKKTSTTNPTPYPDLNAVLRELVEGVQAILSNNFVAACLQGSFAVGDFDRHSDVDFIIAIEEEMSDDQVPALQAMHECIYSLDCGWAQHLEGSNFPRDVLRHYSQRGKQLWYLDNGSRSLVRSDHCNTVVVRWVVREHGVALAGPNPATLVEPIPVEALRQEIVQTISGWGRQILADAPSARETSAFHQGTKCLRDTWCYGSIRYSSKNPTTRRTYSSPPVCGSIPCPAFSITYNSFGSLAASNSAYELATGIVLSSAP